jgi:EAL domain-containing protein (putative c-di-GMP-specific phosphodiesterase class I)
MYRAKRAGGRGFRFFEPADDRSGQQLVVLRSELTRAVQREEFVLHYQPQVDLRSGRVLGAEALLRWNHPERGLLPPFEFLEAAENTGLIVEIGEWVLTQAAEQRRRFAATNPQFRMGINVSMRQVLDPDFGDRMTHALIASGSDTAGLELELTETWVMEDPRRAVERLWPLREMGLRLSIDDFGTGYSNIRGLSELPVDGVKIDREFVSEIHAQRNHQTVVRAIEVLADGLDLEVIAEGVETEAERRWLTEEGITKGQGYLFAKPLPVHEFEQWAKAQTAGEPD